MIAFARAHKKCGVCGAFYPMPRDCSRREWNKSKFCSRKCNANNFIGNRITHGETRRGYSTEYAAWTSMKSRCLNKNHHSYKNYGGRGITIFNLWTDNFPAFLAHIGRKPAANYSLDRINNDGNYEPGNIRWATFEQQAANTRRVKKAKNFHFNKKDRKWWVSFRVGGEKRFFGRFERRGDAERLASELRPQIEKMRNFPSSTEGRTQ